MTMGSRITLVAALALGAAVAPRAGTDGAGGDDLVPVGLARIDITPQTPVRLAGYAARKAESEGVAQRLWAKALAIGGDEGEGPAVVLSIENCGLPARELDQVRAELQRKAHVAPERFAACCTHIHTGPRLPSRSAFYGETPPEHVAHIEAYVRKLGADLLRVTTEALAARRPARLAWARGGAEFAANRRVLKDGRWVGFGVQTNGPVDHAMPLLRITDADGKLMGVVANYACHATTLGPKFNQVHGDWPGCAQEYFESAHPGAMAMVLIGCGADANPEPRDGVEFARRHGRTAADEIERLLGGPFAPLPPRISACSADLALPLSPVPSREELQQRVDAGQAPKAPASAKKIAEHAAALLARLDRGETLPSTVSYPAAVWSFGDRLAMVFLGGEVVVDFARRLDSVFDRDRLWINAYSHRPMPGYIVSARLLREGGYEPESFMASGLPAPLAPEAEDALVAGVGRLIPDAFRVGGARAAGTKD